MKIIQQKVELLKPSSVDEGIEICKQIEWAGRNCYATRNKITSSSYINFNTNLINRGHESPMEFGDLIFDFTTSRAVLAEITRHRLASFAVQSQRYILESGDINFIEPTWEKKRENVDYEHMLILWEDAMQQAEYDYQYAVKLGAVPEEAREVLPNSTACVINMKANIREWRHIFELRCSPRAYPQIRELMKEALTIAHNTVPVLFDDLYEKYVENN